MPRASLSERRARVQSPATAKLERVRGQRIDSEQKTNDVGPALPPSAHRADAVDARELPRSQRVARAVGSAGPAITGVLLGALLAPAVVHGAPLGAPASGDRAAAEAVAVEVLGLPTPSKATQQKPANESERMAEKDLARIDKYKDAIKKSAAASGIPASVLAGLISRETRGRAVTGDHGHANGVTQIHERSYPEWTARWKAGGRKQSAAIEKGAKVLEEKMDTLGKRFPELTGDALLSAALSAYNAGAGAVGHAIDKGKTPDSATTGRDYAADVLARARWFSMHGYE